MFLLRMNVVLSAVSPSMRTMPSSLVCLSGEKGVDRELGVPWHPEVRKMGKGKQVLYIERGLVHYFAVYYYTVLSGTPISRCTSNEVVRLVLSITASYDAGIVAGAECMAKLVEEVYLAGGTGFPHYASRCIGGRHSAIRLASSR